MRTNEERPERERFLILARNAGQETEGLRAVLQPLGEVEVIVDSVEGQTQESFIKRSDAGDAQGKVFITDEESEGYDGIMGRTSEFPKITAWSRAMVHLSRTLRDDEAVWLVEEDVAGDMESFARLVALTRARDADLSARDVYSHHEDAAWHFWSMADGYFDEPSRAFQPLCRLSSHLLREILKFRDDHGHFVFHEVLFASLAKERGMRTLDWAEDAECEDCFSTFRFRPIVESVALAAGRVAGSPALSHRVLV